MLFLACKQYSEGRGICQAFLIIPDRYVAIRRELPSPGGWSSPSSYEHIPEMRDLCLYRPLLDKIESLIGDEMVLHLNLTGWVSTERNWHQDDYLNHRNVNGWYIAVWMALDDISPDCGPFEYIPGSHRWPVLRGDRVRAAMDPEDAKEQGWGTPGRHWTILSQDMVADAVEKRRVRLNCSTERFLGKKGDVLLWHACLQHRGTKPNVPGMERRSLIAHLSEISHQVVIPPHVIRSHPDGGKYAVFGNPLK